MDEDRAAADVNEDAKADRRPIPPTPQRKRWRLVLLGVLLLPFLLFGAWSAVALNWSYSRGDRAGFVQKFSQKGWLCKTWEGELAMVNMPGASQQIFPFTVRNDSVASQVTQAMGSRVSLHYEEHRGVPGSCFGDTGYYVTGVKAVP